MKKIEIDYREKNLIDILKKDSELETKNLILGDIMIYYDSDQEIIIERKTWNDLWSSIIDGRFREQRSRLFEYLDHDKHFVIYIIEGDDQDIKDHLNICNTAIHRLSLIYKFHVHKTSSIIKTAEYIVWLSNQTTLFEKMEPLQNQIANLSKSIVKKKKDVQTPQQYLIAFLQSISGISYDMAIQIIFDESDTLHSFIDKCKNQGIQEFSNKLLKSKNKKKLQKIGITISQKIFTILGILH